jgi:hypothetical protein
VFVQAMMCFNLELGIMLLWSACRPLLMSPPRHTLQHFVEYCNYLLTDTQFPNLVIVDVGFPSLLFSFENREKLSEDVQAIINSAFVAWALVMVFSSFMTRNEGSRHHNSSSKGYSRLRRPVPLVGRQ